MLPFAYSSHLLTEAVDHKWQPYAVWCAILQNYYCDTKSKKKKSELCWHEMKYKTNQKDLPLTIASRSLIGWKCIISGHRLWCLGKKRKRNLQTWQPSLTDRVHFCYTSFSCTVHQVCSCLNCQNKHCFAVFIGKIDWGTTKLQKSKCNWF